MTRAKHFILYLMALIFAVGIAGCKKESEGAKEPEPQDKPTPGPDKPDPGKTDLYQEAFESMKQTHDYNKLVEDLVVAANANVDSANLSLAYMYEYGVGVEQDIVKAKSYYAKEAALNNNEFALEKSKMLGSGNFNYEIVLPEDCDINMNDVVVLYGDSLSFANGDGTFNVASDVVVVKNFKNEFVFMGYRHPSNTETLELNSKETALTLLQCGIPYGFHLQKDFYAQVRKFLLGMEESGQIAEEIEKQIKTQGCYDIETLAPYLTTAYSKINAEYGVSNSRISKTAMLKAFSDDACSSWHDDHGHHVFIVDNILNNDVKTFIKSGEYDNLVNVWNINVGIENVSQACFMAVPGTIDPSTGVFSSKYEGLDYYLNAKYVDASKFWDLGGGSIIDLVKATKNYVEIAWDNASSGNYNSNTVISNPKDILAMWADTHREYQEKYLVVKEDINLEVSSTDVVLRYVYPYNDIMVGAYYFIYYLTVPVLEVYINSDSENKLKNIVAKIFKEFLGDKKWIDSFRKLFVTREIEFSSKKAVDFYVDTFFKIWDLCFEEKTGLKYFSKIGKPVYKMIDKFRTTDYDDGEEIEDLIWSESKQVEKIVFSFSGSSLKKYLKVLSSGENVVTFANALVKMVNSDYRSFNVRFNSASEQFELSYQPVDSVWAVLPYEFVVKSSRRGDIYLYANDKLIASEKDVTQLKYDLSTLETGIYEIKIVCNANDGISEKESVFKCVVKDNPVSIWASVNGLSCEKDESLVLSAELSRLCDIEVFVDDESFYRGDNIDQFYITLPSSVAGTHNGRIVAKIKGVNVAEKPFSYNVYSPLSITNLTLTGTSLEQDESLILSGKVSEACDIAVYVDEVLVSTIKNKSEFYVELPTDKVGKYSGKVKASSNFIETEQSFSYTVLPKKTETDANITPTLPDVSGSGLSDPNRGTGTAPDVKGEDIDQTYNGSTPDVKGENLDQIYNGSGSAPDVKGTNL